MLENGACVISVQGAQARRFDPVFTVLISEKDPQRAMRWGEFEDPNICNVYKVWTWGRDTVAGADPEGHVFVEGMGINGKITK